MVEALKSFPLPFIVKVLLVVTTWVKGASKDTYLFVVSKLVTVLSSPVSTILKVSPTIEDALFIAFIVAFASGLKRTLLYIVFGSLIIYLVNIIRIAVIVVAIYKFPELEGVLHNIIFPSIIYGITFLLWFFWVQKISKL